MNQRLFIIAMICLVPITWYAFQIPVYRAARDRKDLEQAIRSNENFSEVIVGRLHSKNNLISGNVNENEDLTLLTNLVNAIWKKRAPLAIHVKVKTTNEHTKP